MGQTLFYLNGSNTGHQVNSRDEILTVLKKETDYIGAIDIEPKNNEFQVLARLKSDASWICVGKTDKMI